MPLFRKWYVSIAAIATVLAYCGVMTSLLYPPLAHYIILGLIMVSVLLPYFVQYDFSFGSMFIMMLGAHNEGHGPDAIGRIIFLLIGPCILTVLGTYNVQSYGPFLLAYSIGLILICSFGAYVPDGLLGRFVGCCMLYSMASLTGGTSALAFTVSSFLLLLLAVSFYIFATNHTIYTEENSKHVCMIILKRALAVSVLATLAAAAVTLLFYDPTTIQASLSKPAARTLIYTDDGELTSTAIAELMLYVGISFIVFLGFVRIAGLFLKRRGKAQKFTISTSSAVDVGESMSLRHREGGDWSGDRKKIIGLYIKIRALFHKKGLWRSDAIPPLEFAGYISGKVESIGPDMTAFTRIFMRARYSKNEPDKQLVSEAGRMAKDLTKKVKKLPRRKA